MKNKNKWNGANQSTGSEATLQPGPCTNNTNKLKFLDL